MKKASTKLTYVPLVIWSLTLLILGLILNTYNEQGVTIGMISVGSIFTVIGIAKLISSHKDADTDENHKGRDDDKQ